jgi:hypothetical protein
MELFLRIRKYENLHIVFWLIKDTCWMMEWKALGVTMIAPTFLLAVYLVVKTFRHRELFINAAILCWITANSYWMAVEFFFDNSHKELAAIPFAAGMLLVVIYYLRPRQVGDAEEGGFPGGEHLPGSAL